MRTRRGISHCRISQKHLLVFKVVEVGGLVISLVTAGCDGVTAATEILNYGNMGYFPAMPERGENSISRPSSSLGALTF